MNAFYFRGLGLALVFYVFCKRRANNSRNAFAVFAFPFDILQVIDQVLVLVVSEAYAVALIIAIDPSCFYFRACRGLSCRDPHSF